MLMNSSFLNIVLRCVSVMGSVQHYLLNVLTYLLGFLLSLWTHLAPIYLAWATPAVMLIFKDVFTGEYSSFSGCSATNLELCSRSNCRARVKC
ncbi:hypothetical protein Y032_0044g1025 [Ancylostoma ceylanicum]|uniref:Uncharacterized protein n=1 Tax=Ancylostoma ceylanicum TaxID=53326 RepID=A0A016UCZ8_9BILA|nr:hypothetical protein Y032_0044g1025 [Ancylostoma ceylanicum]